MTPADDDLDFDCYNSPCRSGIPADKKSFPAVANVAAHNCMRPIYMLSIGHEPIIRPERAGR
jgi:hypothetical protein